MIRFEERAVALRYAQAFLNVAGVPFSIEQCASLERVIALYREMPTLLFYFQIPLFSQDSKIRSLQRVRTACAVPESLEKLDHVLLEHNRIFLLPTVYQLLIEQSHLRAGRVACNVTSAQPLSERERALCEQFIVEITGKAPLVAWHTDPTLIAGVSMRSDEWLWEDSLDARLRSLAQTLLT